MKLINNKGKLFGFIHVFDLIFVIVLVAVILGAINKFSDGDLIGLTESSERVTLKCIAQTEPYRVEYFESLSVGDQLAEDKKYLDGEIQDLEVIDYIVTETDNQGETITGVHPFLKRANVTFTVTVDFKEPIYQMGKQEIREGALIFLTTEKSALSVTVIEMEVMDSLESE